LGVWNLRSGVKERGRNREPKGFCLHPEQFWWGGKEAEQKNNGEIDCTFTLGMSILWGYFIKRLDSLKLGRDLKLGKSQKCRANKVPRKKGGWVNWLDQLAGEEAGRVSLRIGKEGVSRRGITGAVGGGGSCRQKT